MFTIIRYGLHIEKKESLRGSIPLVISCEGKSVSAWEVGLCDLSLPSCLVELAHGVSKRKNMNALTHVS